MTKKILSVFFIILFFGVIGILYSFFNYTDNEVKESKEYLSPISKVQESGKLDKSWIDNFQTSKKNKYSYPVNELFMHIDLQRYLYSKVKSYKLVIQNMDRYSLFCVMQTLQNFNLPFVVTKQKVAPIIYLESDSSKKLKEIREELKKYDIDSKIIEKRL